MSKAQAERIAALEVELETARADRQQTINAAIAAVAEFTAEVESARAAALMERDAARGELANEKATLHQARMVANGARERADKSDARAEKAEAACAELRGVVALATEMIPAWRVGELDNCDRKYEADACGSCAVCVFRRARDKALASTDLGTGWVSREVVAKVRELLDMASFNDRHRHEAQVALVRVIGLAREVAASFGSSVFQSLTDLLKQCTAAEALMGPDLKHAQQDAAAHRLTDSPFHTQLREALAMLERP